MFSVWSRLLGGSLAAGPSIEGWWLDTPMRLRAKVRTPRGNGVSVVTACVDIRYCVEGGRIALRQVGLSRVGEHNVAAPRCGESWRSDDAIPEPLLVRATEQDLAAAGSRLRRAMIAKWKESDPGAAAELLAKAINGRAAAERIAELIAEEGCGIGLAFTYTNAAGEATARRVTVQALSGDAIRCLDHADDKVKSFPLDRISAVEPE